MFPKRFKLFILFVLFYWLINCTKLDILYHILFLNYWQKLRNTEKPRKTTRNQQLRNPTGGKTEEELCSFFPILLSLCTVTSKISSTRLTGIFFWFKYTYTYYMIVYMKSATQLGSFSVGFTCCRCWVGFVWTPSILPQSKNMHVGLFL